MTWRGEVEAKCRTKQRPRMNPRTGRAHMPKWYQPAKDTLAWQFKALRPPYAPTGDVLLGIEIGVKAKGRGDDDNLLGFVLDALEGVVYANDRQARIRALHPSGQPVIRNAGRDYIRLEIAP